MSSKSDEILSMNYSFNSIDNNKKQEENTEKKNNKGKSTASLGKKQNLVKSPSSSELKTKKIISLPELNNNNRGSKYSEKKLHFTSNSFNKNKGNISLNKNDNRTFTTNNNIYLNDYCNKEKDFKVDYTNEESPIKTIEKLKKEIQNKNKIIESLITTNNNLPITPDKKKSIVNILSTKKKEQINGKIIQDHDEMQQTNNSKILEKKYNDIKREYEKQQKQLNTLRKEEKMPKNKEYEMENRILLEQCNKLNYLYFDVLKKLIEYEDSIKNIHNIKESIIKKDYILIELQDKYSKAMLEISKNNQEINDLKNMLSKRNTIIKQNKKNLDYYFQLSQKLLIEHDNLDMSPKIMTLKNNYENQINELKKSLTFYKEENYRKDRIILELKNGNNNIDEINLTNNLMDRNNKRFLFKNAQKVTKEHFINKENIELKNKINAMQEKIDKLNKKIKDYDFKEKYDLKNKYNNKHKQNNRNNLNNNDMHYHIINNKNNNKNIGYNFNNIDYLTKSNENIEDEDCDFMSNYNMNEFLYILKKCFEAENTNIGDIESKILNGETFNLLVKKDNYNIFILTVSANFCNLLKIIKTKDQIDTLSFVKTFLYNNFISSDNKIDEFQKIFLNCFPDISIYNKEIEDIYLKKIAGYFKDKIELLRKEFESFDLNKRGTITFIALKKIVEKLKINLKKEILEFMIYFMKRPCINNSNNINNENKYSLRDLNYQIIIEDIYTHINNNNIDTSDNSNLSNNDFNEINNNNYDGFLNNNSMNDDNSYIEITNEEYNEKIALVMNSISSEILKKSNNNSQDYINQVFNKYVISDDDGHQIIELSKLVDEIKNSLFIELNQIEIFCLYSKFKINEDKITNTSELIDYESFKNEILSYENQQIKENNTPNELILNSDKNENILIIDINENNTDKNIENNEEVKKEINNVNKNVEEINKKENENEQNNEEIKKGESQNEEYNDFENNNFDNEDESINGLEKIITGEDKE